MGMLFVQSIPGRKVFKCKSCRVDSASPDDILSKEFRGRHGRAYLFESVVNVSLGPDENRYLMTGLHTVNDIHCSFCQELLGWKYEVHKDVIAERINDESVCYLSNAKNESLSDADQTSR